MGHIRYNLRYYFMSIISYYLNSYYTGVLIGYPLREQLNDSIPLLFRGCTDGHGGIYCWVGAVSQPLVSCFWDKLLRGSCYLCLPVPRISSESFYGYLAGDVG